MFKLLASLINKAKHCKIQKDSVCEYNKYQQIYPATATVEENGILQPASRELQLTPFCLTIASDQLQLKVCLCKICQNNAILQYSST